uniref:Variant surface glycoprotein 1108 n=1 Tax=Trypanosoma brucei TaxID=5691 RepID=M4SUL7_9TRYP|nr:variant surface glycoprotein 1108 [Trypanosoma brucei]
MSQKWRPAMIEVILTVLTLASTSFADDSQAKHLAELEALCQLIAVGMQPLTELDAASIDLVAPVKLRTINMSISELSWQKQFTKNEEVRQQEPKYCAEAPDKPSCKTMWKEWETDAIAAADTKNLPQNAKIPAENLNGPQAAAARLALARLIAVSRKKVNLFNGKEQSKIKTATTTTKTKISQALFGKPAVPSDPANACAGTAGSNRQTTCKVETKPSTVCRAAVCLCGRDGTQNQDVCGQAVTHAMVNWNSAQLKALFENIFKKCKQKKSGKLTAVNLQSALTNVLSYLKQHQQGTAVTLVLGTGDSGAGTVCGTSAGGGCVDFTKLAATKQSTAIADDTWVSELQEAATELKAAEAALDTRLQLEMELDAASDAAEQIYLNLLHTRPLLIPQLTAATGQKADKKKECEQHKDNITCTADNNCKWEGTSDKSKGTCKPKDGEVPTNQGGAGTGEGAAGEPTTEKCKGKSQTDCKYGCK